MWVQRLSLVALATVGLATPQLQMPLRQDDSGAVSISTSLFGDFERLARLVDIAYCIGTTGISKPFDCVSRCDEFPTLSLVKAWNTGILLSDSCGYIAVDHGKGHHNKGGDFEDRASSKAIIVAFRGTYSITNTVIDLSTVPQKYVPYPSPGTNETEALHPECTNCTVHMGFWRSWKHARDMVIPEIKALKEEYPGYAIHLVGHSLGGAVACLAALELKLSMGWENVIVTTFGEPRVGNYHLARYIDEAFGLDGDLEPEKRAYRRVTHKDDPVPLLPLDEWGYHSHGGEFYITKPELSPSEGDVRTCIGDEDPQCSAENDSLVWFKLWQLFFAHRDYFWRLGLCVPGGDPTNWGREGIYDIPG